MDRTFVTLDNTDSLANVIREFGYVEITESEWPQREVLQPELEGKVGYPLYFHVIMKKPMGEKKKRPILVIIRRQGTAHSGLVRPAGWDAAAFEAAKKAIEDCTDWLKTDQFVALLHLQPGRESQVAVGKFLRGVGWTKRSDCNLAEGHSPGQYWFKPRT